MDYRRTLRMLAVRDQSFLSAIEADEVAALSACGLTLQQMALARLAALVAMDAAPASYAYAVHMAEAAGLTHEEVVGVLVSVIPVTGGERVVSAAPKLGLALEYDIDAELEHHG